MRCKEREIFDALSVVDVDPEPDLLYETKDFFRHLVPTHSESSNTWMQ